MRYYVVYVHENVPLTQSFESIELREKWIIKFLSKYNNNETSWINIVFNGELVWQNFKE